MPRQKKGKTTYVKEEEAKEIVVETATETTTETSVEDPGDVQLSLLPLDEDVSEDKKSKKNDPEEGKILKKYITCPRCDKIYRSELGKKRGTRKLCPECYAEMQEKDKKLRSSKENDEKIKNKIKGKISQMLDSHVYDKGYVISLILQQIKQNSLKPAEVLSTLNYMTENDLDENLTGSNFYFRMRRYYGAGAKMYEEEQNALKNVPDNVDEILNKKVKVVEKKRSVWIRDNQLNEERRKHMKYGPKIDLDGLEDE